MLGLAVSLPGADREDTDVESTAGEAAAVETAGAIEVARLSHVNRSLVLYDADDRRYTLVDGWYQTAEGAMVQIENGGVNRIYGCGSEPCDLEAHATRIIERRLMIYAELALPDGRYDHEGGSWFRIQDGELIEFSTTP
jgi:hypothetical protein